MGKLQQRLRVNGQRDGAIDRDACDASFQMAFPNWQYASILCGLTPIKIK